MDDQTRAQIIAERDTALAKLEEVRVENLKLLVSFDCAWGIGSGRQCPADDQCMSHRFEAARKDRDTARASLAEASELLLETSLMLNASYLHCIGSDFHAKAAKAVIASANWLRKNQPGNANPTEPGDAT